MALTAVNENETNHYTAFVDKKKLAEGSLSEVALKAKKQLHKDAKSQILVFENKSGKVTDLDLRGSNEEILKRYQKQVVLNEDVRIGPGRPKLGVSSKEVTLLPEHWDWLGSQPGGASVTLRKLVEIAKKKNQGSDAIRKAQDATYKFMTTMAGDFAGYEEAIRALFAKNPIEFKKNIVSWPKDIQEFTFKLVKMVFHN